MLGIVILIQISAESKHIDRNWCLGQTVQNLIEQKVNITWNNFELPKQAIKPVLVKSSQDVRWL